MPLQTILTDALQDHEWDDFLCTQPKARHEQTSGYAQERMRAGFSCLRLKVRQGERIVGGAQVLVRSILGVGKLAYVFQGPIISHGREDVTSHLLEQLDSLSRSRGFTRLRIHSFADAQFFAPFVADLGFKATPCAPRRSCVVDLDQAEEQIMAQMSYSGRRGIRGAQRRGVEVRVGAESDIDSFYDLLERTSIYKGFPIFSAWYFHYIWRLFAPANKLRLLLAFDTDGKPVAGVVVTTCDDRAFFGWGGMSRDARHRNLMGPYLLHWDAILWAKERGFKYYDLASVTQFKQKLASTVVDHRALYDKFGGRLGRIKRRAFAYTWDYDDSRRGVRLLARNGLWRLERRMYGRLAM
ncbi:MAG: peptidoglycan bridge formation glycyltransferase FemA/FemB family protein [Phycisphaerales bacterium]